MRETFENFNLYRHLDLEGSNTRLLRNILTHMATTSSLVAKSFQQFRSMGQTVNLWGIPTLAVTLILTVKFLSMSLWFIIVHYRTGFIAKGLVVQKISSGQHSKCGFKRFSLGNCSVAC